MTQPYGQDPVRGQPTRVRATRHTGSRPARSGRSAVQPQYGQPAQQPYGYGQQPGDRHSAVANAYGSPIGSGAKFGVVGATFAGVGAGGADHRVHRGQLVQQQPSAPTASSATCTTGSRRISDQVDRACADTYFSWLGWVLLIAVVVIAIAATLPSPASGPLRALGAVLAAAAIALTFFAIQLSDGAAYTTFLKHTSVGFYLALGGFLLAGIGALCGPSNR